MVQALSGSYMRWASTIDRDAVTERGLEVGYGEVILPLARATLRHGPRPGDRSHARASY